jgi:hypothetical protein
MLEPIQPSVPPSETQLAEELAKIPYEPLLPVEKKLITWSLLLGIVLLAALLWLSSIFFAVPLGAQ